MKMVGRGSYLLTIKLILYYVIKYFQKKEYKMMVVGGWKQKPRSTECLQQMKKFGASYHRQCL